MSSSALAGHLATLHSFPSSWLLLKESRSIYRPVTGTSFSSHKKQQRLLGGHVGEPSLL